jgi:hypothetical protein
MKMNSRVLGALCLIGNGIWFLDSLGWVITRGEWNTIHQITWDIGAVGGICGILGLITLRATGSNLIIRLLTCLPILGLLLYIISSIVSKEGEVIVPLIAWFLQLAGMLLVGILALITRGWGWRKVTPLLTVLVVPLGMFILGPLHLSGASPTLQGLVWVVLGYAVMSTPAPLAANPPVRERVAQPVS